MPDKIDGTLQPVFELKNKSEFTKWEYRFHAYLELLDLEDLVSDLPRPNGNSPSYAKWRKHSKMVRTWFISAIHNDLLDDIMDCGERLEYADEFLRKIRKIFVGSYAGDHIHKIRYPDSDEIVRSGHIDFDEDGDEDDNQHIAGSTTGGPLSPTPNTDGRDDAVVPFRDNVPESPDEPITGCVHTITPDPELLAPSPSTIHRTIENRSPQTIQQLTMQQNPREQDVETIRHSIEHSSLPPFTGYRESEDLYDSDSDRDNTACHFVVRFAPQDQLIPSSPNTPTTSIVPSTSTVHWSTEVPAAQRTTPVVNRTAEAPKKGPFLVIKPHAHMFISHIRAIANIMKDGYSPKTKWFDIKYLFGMEAVTRKNMATCILLFLFFLACQAWGACWSGSMPPHA